MKLAVEKAKKIITPSEFTKREIIEFYRCLPEKIVVIPHGYDRTVYRPIDDNSKITEILNKYKIKQPYLLFIGRLERKKNILGLINAFGILKNKYKIKSKLVLVGFPGYGYQEAEDRIRELGIEKEIIQTGWLDIKDMPYIICGADLFIFPTFYEGFGLPVLEVMACGIPVAASKIPVIEEIAGDAAYYYNPFSPEQIAETVFKLINDSRLRESLIRKGMERAKLFSWKKSAKMTIELLKTFLKSV
jgi:glycosyltransferase involved in cell wall biosynthesis